MKGAFQRGFIGLAALLFSGCALFDPAPQPMGPVRLVEKQVEIPASAFVCRSRPAKPEAYFDGREHSDWIASLWYAQVDCEAKLKAAGEMVLGTGKE